MKKNDGKRTKKKESGCRYIEFKGMIDKEIEKVKEIKNLKIHIFVITLTKKEGNGLEEII